MKNPIYLLYKQLFKRIRWVLFFIFLFAFILTFIIYCNNKFSLDENTVLIVGNERISLETLRMYYELDPAFPGFRKGSVGLGEYADVIIDKILSEKLARQEGILDSMFFRQRLTFKRNESIVKKFYEKKIKNQIYISEDEIRNALLRMSVKLHVKHLYSPNIIEAENLFKTLQNDIPFDSLAQKVFAGIDEQKGGADLGEISWGDLDPSLEDVAYNLKPGEYSQPVRSRWGYHILQVLDRQQNIMITEEEYREKYDLISKIIRRRKEEKTANEYLKNYLDPFNIAVKKESFFKIVQILKLDSDQAKLAFQPIKPMSDDQIKILKVTLINNLEDPFMTSTEMNWSIGNFLNIVESIPWDKRPQTSSSLKFKDDIGVLIRNEFLLREALHQGVDRFSEIDSLVTRYTQELAFNFYLSKSFQNYKMPADVSSYYECKNDLENPIQNVPSSILPGMNTAESYRLYYSGKELHKKLLSNFPKISIQVNHQLIVKESQRINWNKSFRMFTVPQN